MVIQPDLFEEVVKLRALARRARRLGKQLLNEKDKDRLEQFALELERDAARLETEALRK